MAAIEIDDRPGFPTCTQPGHVGGCSGAAGGDHELVREKDADRWIEAVLGGRLRFMAAATYPEHASHLQRTYARWRELFRAH